MTTIECLICCNPIQSEEKKIYKCPCKASKAHVKCATSEGEDLFCPMCMKGFELTGNIPSILELKTLCCGKDVKSKETYLKSLIELNDNKESKDLSILCPLCSKTINRIVMEPILTNKEIEQLIKKYTVRTCSECKQVLIDDFITLSCRHYYHPLCVKNILNTAEKCKNCNKPIEDIQEKLNECYKILGRNCAYCGSSEDRFALLYCNHYICNECSNKFYNGDNTCFHKEAEGVMGECIICNKGALVRNIVLHCNHVYNIDYKETAISQLKCKECRRELNDSEVCIIRAKTKYSFINTKEETKGSLTNTNFNLKRPYMTKRKFKTPPIDKLKETYTIIVNLCSECNHYREGMYKFTCDHLFICQTCITNITLNQILNNEFPTLCCPKCEMPINLSFIEMINKIDDSKVKSKVRVWESNNIKSSICCLVPAIRKPNGRFTCTNCYEENL